jgi:ABC-2 type transport system permease protein
MIRNFKNIFYIARWEFSTRFRTKSFLFSTFVLPLVFSILITLPVYFITYDEPVSTKLIGFINLSTTRVVDTLQRHLNKNYTLQNGSPEYIVLPVSVENSPSYHNALSELMEVESRKDSITSAYNRIKNLRAAYYNNRTLQNKEYMLQTSYDEMISTREAKDLVEIEYENYRTRLDSVYNREARAAADSLLLKNVLNAYIVMRPDVFEGGYAEYHSLLAGNLLESERLQKIINEVIIRTRLKEAQIDPQQITVWLHPVDLKNFQLRALGPTEWDFYFEFYGAVIGVVLLFMAIFTSGGFLFSSVLQEKTNRVIEMLLCYATSRQIMAGKIFGLGFLGLLQVLIWLCITAVFVFFNLFDIGQISYLNLENAFYFLHYFSLGYLLYAAIFVAIGAIFSSEQEAQQVNIILRTFAILPVLLVFLFLRQPNSEIIRILTYIPLLTPYFMIMKISQVGIPLTSEIYITSILLVVSIIGMVFVAAKIFRIGILMYGKKFTIKEVFRLIRSS